MTLGCPPGEKTENERRTHQIFFFPEKCGSALFAICAKPPALEGQITSLSIFHVPWSILRFEVAVIVVCLFSDFIFIVGAAVITSHIYGKIVPSRAMIKHPDMVFEQHARVEADATVGADVVCSQYVRARLAVAVEVRLGNSIVVAGVAEELLDSTMAHHVNL